MMNVIRLPLHRARKHPILCFVDLQLEYVAEGRALAVETMEPWAENCRTLLAFARQRRMPIAHFRLLQRGALFNPATSFAGWIDEFRPRPSEMLFERAMPSCYTASQFPAMTDNCDDPFLVIVGLTSTGSCLATVLDAQQRGHSCLFVADASWSPPIGAASEAASHEFATNLIGQYCDLTSTGGLMAWLTKETLGIAS